VPPVTPPLWQTEQTTDAYRLTMNGQGPVRSIHLLGGPMRQVSTAPHATTMRSERSGVDDRATRDACAWLRRQLAWEHHLAQLRGPAEVAPGASTSTTDGRSHAGVRQ